MSQRIQDSMLASAREGREVVRAGPFTVTISAHDPVGFRRTDSVLFLTKETS